MVRPVDHDYMDDLPSYSGAGHREYPPEFDLEIVPIMTNVRIEPTGEIVQEALLRLAGTYRGARSRRLAGVSTLEVFWICTHRHVTEGEARACAAKGD